MHALRRLMFMALIAVASAGADGAGGHAADGDPTGDNIGTPYESTRPEQKAAGAIRIAFIGSSYMAAAGGQQNLVPALLRSQGGKVEVGTRLGPGMSVVKQIHYNKGLIPPRYLRYLDRVKERHGAESKEYTEALRKHREWAEKGRGRLDGVLEAGRWATVVFGARGTDEVFDRCVDEMVEKIRRTNPGAGIYLYNTWTDQQEPEDQKAVTAAANRAALRKDIGIIPAGEAMHAAHAAKPELKIFRSDTDSHPGMHGSYLIACTIYAALTGESPVGLPNSLLIPTSYDFGDPESEQTKEFELEPAVARFLQETAWESWRRNVSLVDELREEQRAEAK